MIEETLTQLDENEALVTLILTQWNRVRFFLDRYENQKLDVNKQQEKNIDSLKKELQQEKDQNENACIGTWCLAEKNIIILGFDDWYLSKDTLL